MENNVTYGGREHGSHVSLGMCSKHNICTSAFMICDPDEWEAGVQYRMFEDWNSPITVGENK